MTADVYQPCPCGSGKKLKFCCAEIAPEMDKVAKLQEKGQFHTALQVLDRLEQRTDLKPENTAWLLITRAGIEMSEDHHEEAQATLDRVLKTNPQHLLAIALKATSAYSADGFEIAKPHVHRAFQKCAQAFPEIISGLAMGISGMMFGEGCYLAAREHLALGLRFAREEDREEVFGHLLRFEGNPSIAYPLRSVHPLKDCASEDEARSAELRKARALAMRGCWSRAADRFEEVAQAESNPPDVTYNAALCRAFDGDEFNAMELLHEAAGGYAAAGDRGSAVEAETLAQLLESHRTGDRIEVLREWFDVGSVSKLLSRLDEADARIVRQEVPPGPPENEDERPAGIYDVLRTAPAADLDPNALTRADVCDVVAQFTVYSASEDDPPQAFLTAPEGEEFNKARELLIASSDGELSPGENRDETVDVVEEVSAEFHRLTWQWFLPPKVPGKVRQGLEKEQWEETIYEKWPHLPLTVLGGKTPAEAAKEDDTQIAALGAIYVLDAQCDRSRFHLDTQRLAEMLGIELPAPLEKPDDKQRMHSFSSMRMLRLPIEDLDDSTFHDVLGRAMLIQHRRFLHAVLKEALSRPEVVGQVDMHRLYASLMELARERYDRDEVLGWVQAGKEWAQTQDDAFQKTLRWELNELSQRLDDPQDPELQSLMDRFWNYYGKKLPDIREFVAEMAGTYGLPLPDDSIEVPEPVGGSTSGSALWTPEGQTAEAAGKKLWVPGDS